MLKGKGNYYIREKTIQYGVILSLLQSGSLWWKSYKNVSLIKDLYFIICASEAASAAQRRTAEQ